MVAWLASGDIRSRIRIRGRRRGAGFRYSTGLSFRTIIRKQYACTRLIMVREAKVPSFPKECRRCWHDEKDHIAWVTDWPSGTMTTTCTVKGCDCCLPTHVNRPKEGEPGQWEILYRVK